MNKRQGFLFALLAAALLIGGCGAASGTSYDPDAIKKEKEENKAYNDAHPEPLPPGQGESK